MENLFLLLFLGSFILFIIGLIKPTAVIKWGDELKRTRKSVVSTYGACIIIFFVCFGLTSNASTNGSIEQEETIETSAPEPAIAEEPTVEENVYKNGTHKVGVDIPAGEYLVIANGMGYVEVSSDSKGSFDSIIYNDTVLGNTYIEIKDGEYLKLQSCVAYPVADAPSIIPTDGLYKDGVYKVGKDIPAGEYKATLKSDMGYIEVTIDRRGSIESIITNEVPTGDTYITVEDGQYLKLQGVEIQN